MKRLWLRIKRFRPPLILSAVLALVFSAASIVIVAADFGKELPAFVQYAIFIAAAVFVTLGVWAIVRFCQSTSPKERVNELLHRIDFVGRLADNYSFRTVTFTYFSFGVNVLFALAKGVAGWVSASWWLITLAIYYLILCLPKFILLKNSRKLKRLDDKTERISHEWKSYRACGALLLSMTMVLLGMVILIVRLDSKFTYYGTLIFVVALWDFYNLTRAIIYMIRSRRKHSPIISAIKMLNFATALVSMLSLQTAMFASFGDGMAIKQWMNLATGIAVCVMIFGIGMYMVIGSNRKLRSIKTEESL